MKKLALLCFIIFLIGNHPVYSVDNEMIEDYMDIVSNDCILGDYADAVKYLDKVIQLSPQNKEFKKIFYNRI